MPPRSCLPPLPRAGARRRLVARLAAGAAAFAMAMAAAGAAAGQTSAPPPLLPAATVRALAAELSGTAAKRTVQALTLHHRMRGSRGFRAAADFVAEEAKRYGLEQVEIISLPADGAIFYGTQLSRPAWDADFAELWEQAPAGAAGGGWADARRIASWETRPVTLAEDSVSGEVAAPLVDVGDGALARDYAGKDVRGKLVLAAAQPAAVAAEAVQRGAAGIVSYAQNQPTAWSQEDENQIRWGHLDFQGPPTFAFMVSLKQARLWQRRLAAGEPVRLRASVRAGRHPGSYDVVTAVLPGGDRLLRQQEIVFSCHLDHERPGANDNASGCAAILEVGRTLAKLVREGKLPPPRRTLRFIWPPEIEGTIALLNARPDLAQRARAVIHMDMVGGDAEITKAVFHVTRSPRSLPTAVNDVGEEFGRFVNAQSDAFAGTGRADYPLADPEGGKRALQAEAVDFTAGSDHEVWTDGSWRVPAIYLNDWPDRTIHTSEDALANIDATKLLRAAFIGGASGYYLAGLDSAQVPALWEVVRRHSLERTAAALERRAQLRALGQPAAEEANLMRFHFACERQVVASIAAFAAVPPETSQAASELLAGLERATVAAADLAGSPQAAAVPAPLAAPLQAAPTPAGPAAGADPGTAADPAAGIVYRRNPAPKGPMSGFGFDYLAVRLHQLALPMPVLYRRQGLWGDGALYAYEALNLVDGRRTVSEVRDALAAIYGPLPLAEVAAYLEALAKAGVLAPR